MRTAKAPARLRGCAGAPEPSLAAYAISTIISGERGGSVVECRTPEREVRGSRPTAAVLCP